MGKRPLRRVRIEKGVDRLPSQDLVENFLFVTLGQDQIVENPCRKQDPSLENNNKCLMDSLYLLPSEMGGENVTEETDFDIIPVFKTVLAYPHNDSLQFNDIFNMSWGRKFKILQDFNVHFMQIDFYANLY